MAGKNSKSTRVEAPPVAAVSGVWESRLRRFLERRALAIAILLIALGAARIASTTAPALVTSAIVAVTSRFAT